MKNDTLIQIKDLNININNLTILSSINLEIHNNEIITIIGPNGGGKSTLIKSIIGLIKPSSGEIIKRSKLRMSYLPQNLNINENMPINVIDFLKLCPYFTNDKLQYLSEYINISPLLNKSIHSLSGGQMQYVLLTRALLNNPDLLILDEPINGVDINGQALFYKVINHIRENFNCSILMSSHDLHVVMSNTDRVLCINSHICCQGKPEDIRTHPEFNNIFNKNDLFTYYQHNHNHLHHIDGNVCSKKELDK